MFKRPKNPDAMHGAVSPRIAAYIPFVEDAVDKSGSNASYYRSSRF